MEIYESYGTVIWQTDKDIYGNLHNCKAIRAFLSPFRQLELCEDDEIRFPYNVSLFLANLIQVLVNIICLNSDYNFGNGYCRI